MKIAVISARGLGDGLISMVLSHNFSLRGHSVTTFNPFLPQLKQWFPNQTLLPYPKDFELFSHFDKIIVQDHSPLSDSDLFGDKITLIKENSLDKTKTLAENFALHCHEETSTYNGMISPKQFIFQKEKKRVVIHPTSGNIKKNWPQEKFLLLSKRLKQKGYHPIFVVSPEERASWPESPLFPTVSDLAATLFESGAFIGNDSGVGHLASSLGIPTLSLFSRKSTSRLWRPAWSAGMVVTPPPIVFGAKAKQKYWQKLLTVNKVMRAFDKLMG